MPKRKRQKNTAQPGAQSQDNSSAIATELRGVKHLLILLLVKLGSDSKEIGKALGIAHSTVRSWMPMRDITKISLPKDED